MNFLPGWMPGAAGAGGGGPESTRVFTISPAVSGKSTWDLDVDGPLTLSTAGSWTLAPQGGWLDATVELWGPGGAGGGSSASIGNPGTAATTFGAHISAGPGQGGFGAHSGADGGAGGTASGGDVNTNGNPGEPGVGTTGGTGGDAPNGGSGGAGGVGGNSGQPGNAPGGGGGGMHHSFAGQGAGGGGGSGAYVLKSLTDADTEDGVGVSLEVGDGGAGVSGGLGGLKSGDGAVGRIVIT